MIRMLRTDFDVFTQSFFRYAAASVFLFAVGLITTRQKILDAARNIRILMVPALIMAVHQIFFTAGIFMTSAIVSTLMARLNAIIIPVLSYIIYEDERRVVGSRNFLLGAFLALLGVAGVILSRNGREVDGFNLGAFFIVMGTTCWSIYVVYAKKLVRSMEPLVIISYVSLLSTLFFLPMVFILGDISKIARVSMETQGLLFGSGILGVGIGNVFYYRAIRYLGTSIPAIFFLLMPLSVGIIAFLVLGETLTAAQIIFGAVLVCGCWLVTRLAKKERPPATI